MSEHFIPQAGEVAMPEGDDAVAPAAGATAADATEGGKTARGEALFSMVEVVLPWYSLKLTTDTNAILRL